VIPGIGLAAGCALVAMGAVAFVIQPQVMRKLIAFNVMGGGVFLVLLALAPQTADGHADPVAQALVLTGIVIAIAATALGLVLLRRHHAAFGCTALDESEEGASTDD
jgi:multicomponent Na+:H+ antiporter subunit C